MWFYLLVLMMLCAGCEQQSAGTAHNTKRTVLPHPITSQSVTLTARTIQHEYPGQLRWRRLARIANETAGRIITVTPDVGDSVKQDALLVQLDDAQLCAECARTQTIHQQKQLDYTRLTQLTPHGATTADAVAQARTALTIAQADEQLCTLRLATMRITAPFNGVVIERFIEPNDVIDERTHLFTLADPHSLIAEVFVSELLLPRIRVGTAVQLHVERDAHNSVLFGQVARIHPTIDATHHQVLIEIALTSLPANARAGQFVRVVFMTPLAPRLFIPVTALQYHYDGPFVWIVSAKQLAQKQPVQTGVYSGEDIEITAGLTAGMRIITHGFIGLTTGTAVTSIQSH